VIVAWLILSIWISNLRVVWVGVEVNSSFLNLGLRLTSVFDIWNVSICQSLSLGFGVFSTWLSSRSLLLILLKMCNLAALLRFQHLLSLCLVVEVLELISACLEVFKVVFPDHLDDFLVQARVEIDKWVKTLWFCLPEVLLDYLIEVVELSSRRCFYLLLGHFFLLSSFFRVRFLCHVYWA